MTITIKVCHGHACLKNLSNYTFDRAKSDLGITEEDGGISENKKIKLEKCACQGRCDKGPIVVVEKGGQSLYHQNINPIEIAKIIKQNK